MKTKKTAFLNLVETNYGKNENTIATIRANKDGTMAIVEFVGGGANACFKTVANAWDWVNSIRSETSFFEPTENYPKEWKKNFV